MILNSRRHHYHLLNATPLSLSLYTCVYVQERDGGDENEFYRICYKLIRVRVCIIYIFYKSNTHARVFETAISYANTG